MAGLGMIRARQMISLAVFEFPSQSGDNLQLRSSPEILRWSMADIYRGIIGVVGRYFAHT